MNKQEINIYINVERFGRNGGFEIKNNRRVAINSYNETKRRIKTHVYNDAEMLIINIIPDTVITEKWIVESLMYLQREFTPLITIPVNVSNLEVTDIIEFERVHQCTII
jgi:hypothetical protein